MNNIAKYLIPKPADVAILLPPLLHLGWIVDKDRMFDYAFKHGVNATVDDHLGSRRNYYDACNEAVICFLEDLDMPFDDRIDVVSVCDGDYEQNPNGADHKNFQLAVRIGTNYDGVIPRETAMQLQNFIAPGVKPRWFLDRDEWFWTKSPRLKKLQGMSQPFPPCLLSDPHLALGGNCSFVSRTEAAKCLRQIRKQIWQAFRKHPPFIGFLELSPVCSSSSLCFRRCCFALYALSISLSSVLD